MLERLRIKDLALVERAEIPFGPGLNVITGETGAGKSLLVQSVNLLVGERADPETVREGASAAAVEGEFRLGPGPAQRAAELLGEWGFEFDGETLIVRREIQAGGRSRATVNQSPVTQAALKRLGDVLADLHGQHEHQSLLRPEAAADLLDRLAAILPNRAHYQDTLAAMREATDELARLEQSLASFADRRDWMASALRELEEARLVEGEEEELRGEAGRLAHADRLRELVTDALERLSESEHSATRALRGAAHALEQAALLDPGLGDSLPGLEDARIAAEEAARSLAIYASRLESDPRALEVVEARRDRIAQLTRKHRRSVPELLRWKDELAAELATGEDATGVLERARTRVDETRSACLAAGRSLSRYRQIRGKEWGEELTRVLRPLGLRHARIEFAVRSSAGAASQFLPNGLDEVEIRFTANPGESPRPLRRIASGGELSRVMLALKSALEAQDRVDVLVFDEVDSGIGGAVAHAVGERLRELARHRQVLCVTHLPMIAALASHHLRVIKHVAGGRTLVRIEPLDEGARVEELARMLAGDLATSTTRRQARELLEAAPARSTPR